MALWVENASPEIDAASQYPTIIAVCVCLTTLMTVFVSLRLYVRMFMLKVMGVDDWITIFSAICSITYNGLCIGQSKWGLGLPIASRPKENLNEYSIINFVGRPFYQIGVLGFKVALCVAYLRILSHGQRTYRVFVWITMISCIAGHVACTLVLLFQCTPMRKSWLSLTAGSCLANVPTFTGLAIVTIVYDVVIFLLPIPLLCSLQIKRRRKIALIGVFVLGLSTTLCSFMRLSRIAPLALDGNSTYLVLWGTIELNVGILLTCVPTLAPLFTYFSDKSQYNYRNDHYINAHELHSSDARSRVHHVSSASRTTRQATDSDSQKGILDPEISLEAQTAPRCQGIIKTVQIEVEHHGPPAADNL